MGKQLTEAGYFEVSEYFKILGSPLRLQLLDHLRRKAYSVGELVKVLKIPQPTVSRHLGRLLRNGLVKRARQGNVATYELADPTIAKLCDLACGELQAQTRRRAKLFRS